MASTVRTSGRVARAIGGLYLRMFGWRVEGALPAGGKGVVIAAPHTSNWDMPAMLAVAYVLGIEPAWLGKRELFRWPFGGFMRWLGGIAVVRSERRNMVQQVAATFDASQSLFVVIPPSATRSRATHWKSGFYHIARAANVPIFCAFLDYGRKVTGIGPSFVPSGDVAADMAFIRDFYEGMQGKYPKQMTPVRLLEEDAGAGAAWNGADAEALSASRGTVPEQRPSEGL